jgi:hypothetical protein
VSYCVQRLPSQILAALLASRYNLDFYTHNEPFQLLNSWLEAQVELVEEEKQALFEEMAETLEYQEMIPFYVLCVVLRDKRVMKSHELRYKIAMQALRQTDHDRQALTDIGREICEKPDYSHQIVNVEALFTPEEIRLAGEKGEVCRGVGVIAGLPWVLCLGKRRAPEGESRERVACFLRPCFPEDYPRAEEEINGTWVVVQLTVGRTSTHVATHLGIEHEGHTYIGPGRPDSVGLEDVFEEYEKGWDEVFAADSVYLTPTGEFLVHFVVEFP